MKNKRIESEKRDGENLIIWPNYSHSVCLRRPTTSLKGKNWKPSTKRNEITYTSVWAVVTMISVHIIRHITIFEPDNENASNQTNFLRINEFNQCFHKTYCRYAHTFNWKPKMSSNGPFRIDKSNTEWNWAYSCTFYKLFVIFFVSSFRSFFANIFTFNRVFRSNLWACNRLPCICVHKHTTNLLYFIHKFIWVN